MSKHLNDKYFSNFYDGLRQQIQNFEIFYSTNFYLYLYSIIS